MTVIADTGAIYALIDASDAWHPAVAAWWQEHDDVVLLPATILPEVAHLLATRIGPKAEVAFVRALADGELVVEGMDDADLPRIAELAHGYRDLPLGFVDASVVAAAERFETREILTTDHRHFSVVRPRGAQSFLLLP